MAWTELDKATLRSAIAKGIMSVRYGDREVRYQSLADMRSLLAEMEAATNQIAESRSFVTFGRD